MHLFALDLITLQLDVKKNTDSYKKHEIRINSEKFLADYYDILKPKYDIEIIKRFSNT